MTVYSHSFTGYVPPARYDGLNWRTVRVEESADGLTSWGSLGSQALSPLDTDPTHPLSRNVTVANATLATGYYRLIFVDLAASEAPPSTPVLAPAPSPGMTLAQLRTAVYQRGFHYLYDETGDDTRADYFINNSYIDICTMEDWPFLENIATGIAPITITDLSSIESVIDSTSVMKLSPLDRRNITDDWDTNLATAGSPTFYYLTQGSVVNVYPTNTTDTISVRYWRQATELVSDGDTPLVPASGQSGIIEGAVAQAYADSDNFDAAQQAYALRDQAVENMRELLLNWNRDQPDDFIVITDPELVW